MSLQCFLTGCNKITRITSSIWYLLLCNPHFARSWMGTTLWSTAPCLWIMISFSKWPFLFVNSYFLIGLIFNSLIFSFVNMLLFSLIRCIHFFNFRFCIFFSTIFLCDSWDDIISGSLYFLVLCNSVPPFVFPWKSHSSHLNITVSFLFSRTTVLSFRSAISI